MRPLSNAEVILTPENRSKQSYGSLYESGDANQIVFDFKFSRAYELSQRYLYTRFGMCFCLKAMASAKTDSLTVDCFRYSRNSSVHISPMLPANGVPDA